jgi:hypothetical protein
MSAGISLGIRTDSKTSSNTCVKWGMRYVFFYPVSWWGRNEVIIVVFKTKLEVFRIAD